MIYMAKQKFCEDCALNTSYHFQSWLEELTVLFLPLKLLGALRKTLENWAAFLMENFFVAVHLAKWRYDFPLADVQLRTALFIRAARQRGIQFKTLYTRNGSNGVFYGRFSAGKKFRFETLPDADFLSKFSPDLADDKKTTKSRLLKAGFPVAESKFFWFWQRKAAFAFSKKLGWPLVVKPRSGSVARHCYTDIRSEEQLQMAFKKVFPYSPCFLVERYLAGCSVYRATVVDFENIFCCQQIPANVVGDGLQTIRQLINQKNSLPNRGRVQQNEFTLFQIKEDEVSKTLLDKLNYDYNSIPAMRERVFLQKNPFLRLGGDIVEVTEKMHPDNKKLFSEVARNFDLRLVGIDFLAPGISVSFRDQQCAILEVNLMHCIEMHQMPSEGQPQNIAEKVVDMVFKYYFNGKILNSKS